MGSKSDSGATCCSAMGGTTTTAMRHAVTTTARRAAAYNRPQHDGDGVTGDCDGRHDMSQRVAAQYMAVHGDTTSSSATEAARRLTTRL